MFTGNRNQIRRGTRGIRMATLALAATAALPALAFASSEGNGNPQEQARIEEWIQQVIQGNSDTDRQEQARIERLVQQALRSQQAARPAEMAEAGRAPLAGTGMPGRGR